MMKTNAFRAMMLAAIVIAAAGCHGKEEEAETVEKPPIVLGQQDIGSVRLARINSGALLTGSL